MPHEIVDVFDELGAAALPVHELDMNCCCPDWGVPCKHASAVLYVLAEAFDDDPFLVLAWRGRGRDELLDALRADPEPARRVDPLAVDEVPLESRLADFYSPGISLSRLRERPARVTAPPELLLRALDAAADPGAATSRWSTCCAPPTETSPTPDRDRGPRSGADPRCEARPTMACADRRKLSPCATSGWRRRRSPRGSAWRRRWRSSRRCRRTGWPAGSPGRRRR